MPRREINRYASENGMTNVFLKELILAGVNAVVMNYKTDKT